VGPASPPQLQPASVPGEERGCEAASARLFTNERVQSEEQAWETLFSYKRRWQIETSFRSGKCELAMESRRRWSLENRLKLVGSVLLVYAFFLFLARRGSY
jgi:hypothetical protein